MNRFSDLIMFHTLALFTTIPVVASFGWHNTTKAPPSTSPVTLLDFSTKQDSYSCMSVFTLKYRKFKEKEDQNISFLLAR